MRCLLAFACFLLLALPVGACAWGPAPHRMVAELAEGQLTPATQVEVRRLLGKASLTDVAPWADEIRNDPAQRALWRETAPLHFVNFADAACRYVARRDCPGGRCIVAGIERYARVLADRGRPDAERAQALRFVVHFIADVHQPLHAGYRPDRGGNRYQVRWQGRGTNLHAVWDSPVLASRGLGWRSYARELAGKPLPRATGTPASWAEESCRITRDGGLYPRGHRLDAAYAARMRPLAEQRVRVAAARLARMLNRALDR
ncbi:S1/P1 nuclease [Dokdonella sp.]|mgnify:CR=1 FL=1|uniref:S1/P1 nuclease n=1 Tax=Dokdonella sp. TaxID=2291710 RepID=UPI0031C50B51|nr:S1/P1 nuclease [Dokdonella sp.]